VKFQTTSLALGASLLAIVIAAPAMAQTTTPPAPADATAASTSQTGGIDASTIVVTGYGRSVANALRVRRNSVSIVDSLSAEDVGKLPDVSIADALSRLPGVAVQTAEGRGEYLSIRGFSGDFTGALLNGREIATIDDNRRFDYSMMPGDLFNRVDVIKTASADLMATGLAGTVNLQTIDPLTNKRVFSINLQGEMDGYHKLNPDLPRAGYKVSAIWIDKFADDTIGISLGASAIQSSVQNKQWAAWGYPGTNGSNQCTTDCQLGGAKWFADTNTLYRQTGFGHIVYKPDDKLEVSIDGLYSNYKYREYQRGVEVPLSWGNTTLASHTISDGFDQTAVYNNVYAVQRNNYNMRDAYTEAFGANLKYAFNEGLRLEIDGGYSKAHRKDHAYETYTGTGNRESGTADTATITRNANGTYQLGTTLNYTNPNLFQLTDPQGWGYYSNGVSNGGGSVIQAGYINEPEFTDTIRTGRATLTQDFHNSLLKNIELGVNYEVRTKVNSFTGYYLVPPTGTTETPVPASAIIGSVNPAYANFQTLAYNVPAAVAALTGSFQNQNPSQEALQWRVSEKVLTGYVQANFDGTVGGLNLAGNLGGQVVHTAQSSTGHDPDPSTNGTYLTETKGANYTYFLPSFNMRLALSNTADIHIGVSRSMSRAQMSYQNASYLPEFVLPTATSQPTMIGGKYVVLFASGGNPYLRPYWSDNIDIGAEKFFAHGQGIIGANYFFKHVGNFYNPGANYQTDLSAFTSLINYGALALQGISASQTTTQGYVVAPDNSGHGWVDGVELQATVPLNMIDKALDGFGVRGSGSWTESDIRYSNGTVQQLPGLSKWVINAQAYFEKWGFNARVSYQYRSDFQGQYLAFGQQLSLESTKGRSTVDAQIGYDFKSGRLNGLSAYLQGHNLTNSPFVTYYNNDPKQIENYETYGPTYLAGVTMKF